MQMIARGWVAAVLLAALSSCESSEPQKVEMTTAGAAGAEPEGPECNQGSRCRCENGLVGELDCPASTCNCDSCPALTINEPFEFDACGGDAKGDWRLKDISFNRFSVAISNRNTSDSGTCYGQLPPSLEGTQMLLGIEENAYAFFDFSEPAYQFQLPGTCVKEFSGGFGCSAVQLVSNELACDEADCELCRCSAVKKHITSAQARWAAQAGRMDLSGKTTDRQPLAQSFSYCVKGNELLLDIASGDILATLERVYATGVPVPCSMRSLKDCVADCYESSGKCFGKAYPLCSLSAVAEGVAGCGLATQATCQGEVLPCAEQIDCSVVNGCSWSGSECLGEPSPCAEMPLDTCNRALGCSRQAL